MKSVFNSYLLKGGFAAFCLSAGLMIGCVGGSSKADIPTPPRPSEKCLWEVAESVVL